ncbi:MAG: hypothetical protein ACR2IT_09800, partial [Pirellulales bacterium]
VPVVYVPAKEAAIVIVRREGSEEDVAGDILPAQASGDVFGRTGAIVRLAVRLGSQSRNTSP